MEGAQCHHHPPELCSYIGDQHKARLYIHQQTQSQWQRTRETMPGSHCKERDRDPAVEVKPPIQSLTQVPEATRGLGNQAPLTAPPKDLGGLGRPSPDPGQVTKQCAQMESEENRDQPPPKRTEGHHPVFICWVLTRGDCSREPRPQQSQGTNS